MKLKSSLSKYDVDQGFQQPQETQSNIQQIQKNYNKHHIEVISKDKKKQNKLSKKQQAKLSIYLPYVIFQDLYLQIAINHTLPIINTLKNNNSNKFINPQPQINNKINQVQQKNEIDLTNLSIEQSLSKISKTQLLNNKVRSQIGDNFQLKEYNSDQVKIIKQNILNSGGSLVFQNKRQQNTHAIFKKILKSKNSSNFLKSKYNSSLLQKLNQSYINPKNQLPLKLNLNGVNKKNLQFIGDFQNSNLDFVTQTNPFQYDVYLKADTNTLGHQNWFYFKVLNYNEQKKNIFLNICNLKRNFKMIKKGQKVFFRCRKIIDPSYIKTSIQTQEENWTEWTKINDQMTIQRNSQLIQTERSKKNSKVYKLSFPFNFEPLLQYQFSLLPPFTYSNMLSQIEQIQNNCKNAVIQALTYSLLGLYIPVITFTNRAISNQNKSVILISCRIHPGQSNSSYVASGILKKLSQQSDQTNELLEKNIIKIIPMLNPDGVILGNFRTNYLGNDLNRCFNQENQALFPQVIALKQLGSKLKLQFKQRFLCFLDLHGHSSQKNIFAYGPDYDQNHKKYIYSRFLPKTLSFISEQFKYEKCTFNLQPCKANTARGYFLTNLKVMSFTIQASYALYDNNKNQNLKNCDLTVLNLKNFGEKVVQGIIVWIKSLSKNIQQCKNVIAQVNDNQSTQNNKIDSVSIVIKIKKQIKKQSMLRKKLKNQQKLESGSQSSEVQQSDAQSESQDIPIKERIKLQRKTIECNSPQIFPRILKPAIIHQEVNPPLPLISVSKIGSSNSKSNSNSLNNSLINQKIKRDRYQYVRSLNVNNAYTQYLLKQVQGLQSLRPSVNLMKLQRKELIFGGSNIYSTK